MVSTSILKPSGTGFGWCINQFVGCAHGCKYCYGMAILHKSYVDWLKARPKKNVIEDLKKDIQKLNGSIADIRDIFLGSVTDSYQPIERELGLTRQVIQLLKERSLPFTILTKSDLVLRDVDLFKNYKWCRVGVTITSLDDNVRSELEPFSSNVASRIKVLETLKDNNVSTYVSCEPIFPIGEANPIEIVKKLRAFTDLFEFGMWNPQTEVPARYREHHSERYYAKMFREIIEFCDTEKINYGIATHSRSFVERHGLPFKTYPSLKSPEPERYVAQNLNDF